MVVKPAPGRTVRYPNSDRFLPAGGAKVAERDPFWHKRIIQGDVITVLPKEKVKKGSEQ